MDSRQALLERISKQAVAVKDKINNAKLSIDTSFVYTELDGIAEYTKASVYNEETLELVLEQCKLSAFKLQAH